MKAPTEKFYRSLIDDLVYKLDYSRQDIENEYSRWIEKHGDTPEAKGKFFREAFELGRKHFQNVLVENEYNRYSKLIEIERLYCTLLEKEGYKVTPATANVLTWKIKQAGQLAFACSIEIIAPGDQCSYAKQFDGVFFDYDTVLRDFPMDLSLCDRARGCICSIGFEGVRDENGRLKRR